MGTNKMMEMGTDNTTKQGLNVGSNNECEVGEDAAHLTGG